MKPTELLQGIRQMRFKEAYEGWHAGELTQAEAARLLGMCDRSFRRYLARYDEFDMQGLIDKRIEQISHRRAPVDEVMKIVGLYSSQYAGWNVKHFHSWYRREHQGTRSYTWVKNALQGASTSVWRNVRFAMLAPGKSANLHSFAALPEHKQKRTIHLLQNRTSLFARDTAPRSRTNA